MISVSPQDVESIVSRVRHWPQEAVLQLSRALLQLTGGTRTTGAPLCVRYPGRGNTVDSDIVSDREAGWTQARQELDAVASLEKDWDEAGASPPSSELLASAREWLRSMPGIDVEAVPPDSITASSEGAVVFYWQRSGLLIEATLAEPGRVEWLEVVRDQPRHFESGTDLAVVFEA